MDGGVTPMSNRSRCSMCSSARSLTPPFWVLYDEQQGRGAAHLLEGGLTGVVARSAQLPANPTKDYEVKLSEGEDGGGDYYVTSASLQMAEWASWLRNAGLVVIRAQGQILQLLVTHVCIVFGAS